MAIDNSQTFLGEGELLKPATRADVRYMMESVMNTIHEPLTMHREKEIQTGRLASRQTCSTPRNTLATETGLAQMTAVTVQSVQGRDVEPPTASTLLLQKSKPSKRSPIPGIIIPNLNHRSGSAVWRDAIEQWEKGDADNDLPALKDWPKEWYTGERRLVYGSKRRTRQIIAEEYERLVS